MKILEVINFLRVGGAEKLVSQLAPMLWQKGHEVDVCLFNGEKTPISDELERTKMQQCPQMKIYRLSDGGPSYSFGYVPKLRKIMKGYDIVHTHNTPPQFIAALASLGLKNVKLVTTEHSTDNRRRHMPFFKLLDKRMYRCYDKIITISNQAEENLLTYLGADFHSSTKKVTTIMNGVNVESIHQAKPYIEGELFDENGNIVSLQNCCKIIQVAAFRRGKEQKTLMDSLRYLNDNTFVWLVGDGELHDEIHKYADSLPWRDRIVFFGNRSDVPSLLHTADIVCMSTQYEGLSLSNIEGMSAEKPFVASDVDGIREVTKGYGLLFPQGDAEALSRLVRKLQTDPDFYNDTASRCYQRAKEFDISKMVDEYNALFLSVKA